jgi:hypothetical protein
VWLQRTGWTTETVIDDEVFPAADTYAAGPRASAQIPGLEGAAIGVVAAETIDDVLWYLGDGTGPADCSRCRTSVGELFGDAMNTWSAQQVEPVLTCRSCRHTAAPENGTSAVPSPSQPRRHRRPVTRQPLLGAAQAKGRLPRRRPGTFAT